MAPPKRPRTVCERVAMQVGGLHPESKDALIRAEAVLCVVSGEMLASQAARKFGIGYSTISTWIRQDHYEAVAERYQEKIYQLQEQAVLCLEKSIEAMRLISEQAAAPEWLASADPDRINAMSCLFKSLSDTTIKFIVAAQNAANKAMIELADFESHKSHRA